MARFRPDAFPGGNPWQVSRSMYPKRGLGREKRPSLARFARHVSEMSWLWQDMRAMYPKSPANRLSGMHRAKILPGRDPFRCTDPLNHAYRTDLAIRRSASDRNHGAALMVRLLAYGRQGRVRAASCRAGWRCQRSAWLCGVLSADGKASIGEAPLADPRHQQLCRISRVDIRGDGSGRGCGKEAPIKRPRRARAACCLCKRLLRLRAGYATNF